MEETASRYASNVEQAAATTGALPVWALGRRLKTYQHEINQHATLRIIILKRI
jgi:hypothetical protein